MPSPTEFVWFNGDLVAWDQATVHVLSRGLDTGTGENLFLVRDGVVTTPPTTSGALDRITRATVITLLDEVGHPVREEIVTRSDLSYADEAFFNGTAAEVTPIREIDDRPVGDGTPGPVTRLAQDRCLKAVHGELPGHRDWLEYA